MIADYLRSLDRIDAAQAALYLAGTSFAETDRRVLNVGAALLSKTLAKVSNAGSEAVRATYRRYGDLGSAARDVLEGRKAVAGPPLTLKDVEDTFTAIAATRSPGAKLPFLLHLLTRAEPFEAKYLFKLVSGDMRIGVKQSLVEEAIADAYGAEVSAVRRAVMLQGNLADAVVMAVEGQLANAAIKLFHPLGFMLASPVESAEKAIERFRGEAGEASASLRQAIVEDKYDGIRAQLHCGDSSQPGRVDIFSRSRDDISASFPELTEAFSQINEPLILDGEILAWNAHQGRALPFSALQQRLGRKRISMELLEQTPVVFMTFDVLYHNNLMLEQPLAERRAQLEDIVARHSASTTYGAGCAQILLFRDRLGTAYPRLMLAAAVPLENAAQLDRAYNEARLRGNEGVMLKDLAREYQPGRRGLAWLKMKRELATLDVVVTGAEYGHGRRAGVLSDYTFAVRDGDILKNVGKAYSGLTDAEIARLTEFFFEHTLEDFGGFRTVEPAIVLEVAFNNVMRSDRHESGFALRFPRIVRIRNDKPVTEVDTLVRVEEIYHSQPDGKSD
jgi:DNA ligase-1